MQALLMIDSVGIMINASVSVKNSLIKVGVMMDSISILVCGTVNAINRAISMNIWIMWIVNAVKCWSISVEKCGEDIYGNEMVCNATLFDYGRVCSSSTLYVILLIVAFIIIMGISGACFYFYCRMKENYLNVLFF